MSDAYRALVEQLRADVVQPADGGEATRQRILRAVSPAKPRSRRARTLLLLAAAFLVSTAFALYIASPAAHETAAGPEREAPPPQPIVVPAGSTAAPAAPSASSSSVAPSAPAAAPGDAKLAAPKRSRAARRPARNAPAGASTSSSAGAAPPAAPAASTVTPQQRQLLYIEAHRQHFRGAPQQALAAWDAFLATAPSGQLRLEAQYNRAVTLVRLGRRAEAESALQPFARAEHGGFRQAEAQQLLQQLAR